MMLVVTITNTMYDYKYYRVNCFAKTLVHGSKKKLFDGISLWPGP